MFFNRHRACIIHLVCTALHLVSTSVIYGLATRDNTPISAYNNYVNKDFFAYTDWKIYCYANATRDYSKFNENNKTPGYCPDSTKLFFVERGDNAFDTPVNILGLALAFTSVSAFVHFISAILCKIYPEKYTLEIDSTLRFTMDYAVSAPVMLALINIVFGANSISGVIVAPIILNVALVLASLLLNYAVAHGNSNHDKPSVVFPYLYIRNTLNVQSTFACFYFLVFAALCLMYIVSLVPTIVAVINVAKLAPDGVLIFMVGFLFAFSSFIVPYALELYKQKYGYFVAYAALSLNAKAILHSFLAISVLQQAKLYNNSFVNVTGKDQNPPRDMTTQETDAYIIVFVTPLIGFILYVILKKLCNPLSESNLNIQTLIQQLIL
jgi:hypothetical protein